VKYTVVCDYFATGEGRTISVWMGLAENQSEALGFFERSFEHGDYWAKGACVIDGFAFDNDVVVNVMNDAIRSQMLDDRCNRSFSAQLHFNYG